MRSEDHNRYIVLGILMQCVGLCALASDLMAVSRLGLQKELVIPFALGTIRSFAHFWFGRQLALEPARRAVSSTGAISGYVGVAALHTFLIYFSRDSSVHGWEESAVFFTQHLSWPAGVAAMYYLMKDKPHHETVDDKLVTLLPKTWTLIESMALATILWVLLEGKNDWYFDDAAPFKLLIALGSLVWAVRVGVLLKRRSILLDVALGVFTAIPMALSATSLAGFSIRDTALIFGGWMCFFAVSPLLTNTLGTGTAPPVTTAKLGERPQLLGWLILAIALRHMTWLVASLVYEGSSHYGWLEPEGMLPAELHQLSPVLGLCAGAMVIWGARGARFLALPYALVLAVTTISEVIAERRNNPEIIFFDAGDMSSLFHHYILFSILVVFKIAASAYLLRAFWRAAPLPQHDAPPVRVVES